MERETGKRTTTAPRPVIMTPTKGTLPSWLGTGRRLEERVLASVNNFDVLRLVAATMVLVSHSFPLSGHDEPFAAVLGLSLGGLGVLMFFAISGFLIAKSWCSDPRWKAFFIKRALRIMPGLIVAGLVAALVIGPLFTDLSLGTYLTSAGIYEFLARNSLLFTFDQTLPGVFTTNVYTGVVNGSLWTLPLEVCAYGLLATLGVLGLLRRPWAVLALLAFLTVVTSPYSGVKLNVAASPGGVDGGQLETGADLVAIFVASSALFLYRHWIPLHPALFVAVVASFLLSRHTNLYVTVMIVAVPYAALFLAYWRPSRVRIVTRNGDLSYGIYIYAFPVQQAVAHLWDSDLHALTMIVVSLPVTYALAWLSWRLVESPALRFKPGRPSLPSSTEMLT